jgi:hypothetical protein
MTISMVDRILEETGISARVEVVDMVTQSQAERRHFLGSPSVRVDGVDVEPGSNGRSGFTLLARVYRTGQGLQGWPNEHWIEEAVVLAAGQSLEGAGVSSRSSATSP